MTGYATGQIVRFIPAATNTGATTLNITPSGASALGARNIFSGGAACVGGEIRINIPVLLYDDGTQYNVLGPFVGGNIPSNVYINDTANANMTTGLTINQGAADNEILAFKSSDVAHGVTGETETDTYAMFQKAATVGGLDIRAVRGTGLGGGALSAIATTVDAADTTKSTAGRAAIEFRSAVLSGSSRADVGANGNIVTFSNNNTTRFILDSDGDSHQDVGTAWTNFDHFDDVATLDALAYNVARPDDQIRLKFGEWMLEKRDILERAKLVTFNKDGHHFVNMSKLAMLLTGAVRQLGDRLCAIEMKQLQNKE